MLKRICLLLLVFLLYSLSSVASKLASQQGFLSSRYIIYFCVVIFALGSYAVLWQKILSEFQLSRAFLFKSITILFTLAFSYFLFGERIAVNNIIGSCLIVAGICVLAWKG